LSSHELLRDAYLASVVEIDVEDRRLVLEPLADGRIEGPFPDGVGVVHVITAWNPRSEPLPPEINTARQRRLQAVATTLQARWTATALGRSVDGSWSEDCLAIADADEEAVLELARRFEQHAIYAWTPDERAVVWASSPRRDTTGWRCTVETR
jgi:hypothetical protein